jgi:hypothetical protein
MNYLQLTTDKCSLQGELCLHMWKEVVNLKPCIINGKRENILSIDWHYFKRISCLLFSHLLSLLSLNSLNADLQLIWEPQNSLF